MNQKNFDCIVIGGGWGGMAFALLYAMQGKKTALFESHDTLGGYGHCFERNGYQFCANMHYFFDTHPGGTVDHFLRRVQLEKEILFTPLHSEHFDIIKIKNYCFGIPANLELYQQKLIHHFPDSKEAIIQLFKIRENIVAMSNLYTKNKLLFFLSLYSQPIALLSFSKYFLKSVTDVLDQLNIHGTLRAILLSRVGNFGMLSQDIPLLYFLLEMTYYTNCASFPTFGMKHFVDTIHQKLIEYNVSIYLNTEIKKINHKNNNITSVVDIYGEKYTSNLFVSNIDPQLTLKLLHYPISAKYNYQYTYSCFSLYLGLKHIKLVDYNLGNFNTWYFPTNDIDLNCRSPLDHLNYKNSFLFISTPSAHVRPETVSLATSHTMQIVAPANYRLIAEIYKNSPDQYKKIKLQVKNQILDTLADHFIPSIRNYLDFVEIWSPLDLAAQVKTPCGALYGMSPNKRKIIYPVGYKSPFANLYFVGATATNPGLSFVLGSAMKVLDKIIKK